MNLINILETSEFFYICKENDLIDENETEETFEALSTFEGDSDYLVYKNENIYFCKIGENICYYSEVFGDERKEVENILLSYFEESRDYKIEQIEEEKGEYIAIRPSGAYFYLFYSFEKRVFTNKIDLLKKAEAFEKAYNDLVNCIDDFDNEKIDVNEVIERAYPFDASFDEIGLQQCSSIHEWVDSIRVKICAM